RGGAIHHSPLPNGHGGRSPSLNPAPARGAPPGSFAAEQQEIAKTGEISQVRPPWEGG
ncbi:hypothetical protein TIFTF001_051254, partial [Ficus carica]